MKNRTNEQIISDFKKYSNLFGSQNIKTEDLYTIEQMLQWEKTEIDMHILDYKNKILASCVIWGLSFVKSFKKLEKSTEVKNGSKCIVYFTDGRTMETNIQY